MLTGEARGTISWKSNQLQTGRKDLSGTVLKSKPPPLVLSKGSQLCFVLLVFFSSVPVSHNKQ